MTSPASNRDGDRAQRKQYLAIAEARRGPYFYLVDSRLRVVASRLEGPHEPAPSALPPDVARSATALIRSAGFLAAGSALDMIGPGVVLRVLRLESRDEPQFGLFIERYQQRDLIRAAARRFDLTAREIEVLDLLMLGEPTSAIAGRLTIAETTVQQHVKNLGAKIGVTTRKAIVGAVLRSS